MKKAILGTLLGAIVYFVWGAASWMLIPWHAATTKAVPQEQLVSDTLKTVIKEHGTYSFPQDMNNPDKAAWEQRHREGPIGFIVFSPTGKDAMAPSYFISGFIICLLVSALLMWILWASRLTKMVHQIHLAAAVGLIAGFATNGIYWNWMSFPTGFTIVAILDLLFGFILTGAVMARFVPVATSRPSGSIE